MIKKIITSVFLSIILTTFVYSQTRNFQPVRIYDLNDWISFKNCNHPTSLAIGKDFIYYGTTGGIVSYNYYNDNFIEPYSVSDGLVDDTIEAVLFDPRTNYIWAGHKGGVSYLTPTADQWEFIDTDGIMSMINPVTRLGLYKEDIWAVAPGGFIFKIDRLSGTMSYVPETELSKMDIDWNISRSDPIPRVRQYFLHPNTYELIEDGVVLGPEMREFEISLFYSDVRQDIYGGIWGLGLLTGDTNIKSMTIHPFGPLDNSINALETMDNNFIMGSSRPNRSDQRSGVTFFDPGNMEWKYKEPRYIYNFPTDIIHDIEYKNRKIWYATDQGLVVGDQKNGDYRNLTVQDGLIGEFIYSIGLEDSLAWVGSQLGLSMITTDNFLIKNVHLTPDQFHMKILKIEVGPQNIWIGTDNGLYSVDRKDHRVTHYDIFGEKIDLKQPVVASYPAIASSDSLTVAFGNNSFMKYQHNTKKWSQLPELPEINIIYDMAIYENYLWAGTNKGAYLINLDNNYREHYTRVDGLAGMRVYQIVLKDQDVWFGTNKGLTKYYWKKYVQTKN